MMKQDNRDDKTEQERQSKAERLTNGPLKPLIIKLALPSIVSMLISTFYNMADTFFVGQMQNTSATGAVGVVMPVMALIQAFGYSSGTVRETLSPANSAKATKTAPAAWRPPAFFTP